MNKRIEELAEQAAELTRFERNNAYWRMQNEIQEDSTWRQQFAKLIIKECCAQLIQEGNNWEEFSRNPPEGQETNAQGALFAAYRLKEDAVYILKNHFGVE